MKLPRGTLKKLESKTGISPQRLSDYAAARIRPGRKRALDLENACRQIGRDVPAVVWLYESSREIKSRLSGRSTDGRINQENTNAEPAPVITAGANQG